ncbi:MAG TPA: ABC transporter ATP-binding protein [bacterium]
MSGTIATATSSPPAPQLVLKTEGLFKRYGNVTAVDGLDLSVYKGEVFGLLGPNGAGKSTTIHMVCGLLNPDGGKLQLFGRAVRSGDGPLRSRIGVCPQEIVLWSKLTCLEQLTFMAALYNVPEKAARHRALELVRDLGLYENRNQLASALSGGMQRRLNLMLALVHDPELVVLDEPEAGLDPQSRVLVREYIRSLARKKTVLFTTHNMDEAERVCDRVAIIDRGKLLRLDTPERLKQTSGNGGVLEIQTCESDRLNEAVASLAQAGFEVKRLEDTLVVRGRNVAASLPQVLERLRNCGVSATEVKLRENSLEDAFIALTGRRLRE